MISLCIPAHHRGMRCCTVPGSAIPGKPTTTSRSVSSVCLPPSSGGMTQTTRGIQQQCSAFPARYPRCQRKGRKGSCLGNDPLPRPMTYSSEVPAIPPHGDRTQPFLTSRVRESPSTTHIPPDARLEGETITKLAVKDYNRGRSYLSDFANREGVPVFDAIDEALECVIQKCKAAK